MKTGKTLIAALMSVFPSYFAAEDYNIPVDTEGMKKAQARLRKMRAAEQPLKRVLKKKRGKKHEVV